MTLSPLSYLILVITQWVEDYYYHCPWRDEEREVGMGLFVQPATAPWSGVRIELFQIQSLNSEWLFHTFMSWNEDSVQFSSVSQSCLTLCDPMNCSTPGLLVHHQLPEFTQTHIHWVSDAIQPSHPVLPFSSCSQSLPASESFPISPLFAWGGQSTGVSALASFLPKNTQDFRMDWLDLRAVQGTLKSLLQNRSSKASILQRSAFFTVQLSHPYMTTGKNIALTRRTFVNKVMSLLFNKLSRLVIAFLLRSKAS